MGCKLQYFCKHSFPFPFSCGCICRLLLSWKGGTTKDQEMLASKVPQENGIFRFDRISSFILIAFLSPAACIFSTVEDSAPEFVAGAERTTLPDPLVYSTYFPLIYEVDVPFYNFSVNYLNVPWPTNFSTVCEFSPGFEENWKSMACPVMHFMMKTVAEYYPKLTAWMSLNSTSKTTKIDLPSCFEILRHFPSFTIGHEAMMSYLDEDLKSCPLGQVAFLKLEDSLDSSPEMYEVMLRNFLNEYVPLDQSRVQGFDRFAVSVDAYLALQSLQLLDFVEKAVRWTDAVSTCQAGRIPQTIISRQQLADGFQTAQNLLNAKDSNNFILTIDPDDFSTYYKLKLADCAFTTRGTYLIRILIPLRRANEDYKLSLMTPLPFLRRVDDDAELCQYTNPVSPFLVETRSGFTITGDCEGGSLCLVPDLSDRPMMDYCLHALVLNSTKEIVDKCQIQCYRFNPRHLPYFRRLSSNKYAILGRDVGTDILVSCANQPFKIINPPEHLGTLEITLPCECHIVHGKDILHARSPCSDSELRIRNVLPIAWSPSIGNNETIIGLYSSSTVANKTAKTSTFIGGYKRRNVSKRPISLGRFIEKDGKSTGWGFYTISFIIFVLILSNLMLGIAVFNFHRRIYHLERLTARASFCDNPAYSNSDN